MLKLRARLRILLYFLQETHVREKNLLVFPEIKKMDNNGNGNSRERKKKRRVNKLHVVRQKYELNLRHSFILIHKKAPSIDGAIILILRLPSWRPSVSTVSTAP